MTGSVVSPKRYVDVITSSTSNVTLEIMSLQIYLVKIKSYISQYD